MSEEEEYAWIVECRDNPAWGAATIVRYANRIAELEAEDHITKLESDNATIVEDAAMVADENKRLKRIAEAAVRYLTHQDYDGLLVALRAEGYLQDQGSTL